MARVDFYFIHDRPYTRYVAKVKAYDLKQARNLLKSHFPKPHAWVFGCVNTNNYWKVFKWYDEDPFWDHFVVDYHIEKGKKILIGSGVQNEH